MPVEVASRAGAAGSGWLRVGDSPWRGHVTRPDGDVLEVEELGSGSWKVTDETGKTVGTGAQLEPLLKRVLT